ncbi:MAG: hypothetical protein HY619_05805 [Thaumarchaeota archaeon]|nr:hypothetical protein [Nitrososphaerota archaeon]
MLGLSPKIIISGSFIVIGVIWLGSAFLGEGPVQLILPGLASLLTGTVLLRKKTRWAKPLMIATNLYNLVILAYQAFASYVILVVGVTVFGSIALVAYTLATLFFLWLLFYSSFKLGEEASSPSPTS